MTIHLCNQIKFWCLFCVMFQNFKSVIQLFDVWTDRYATIVISLYFGTLQNETCTCMRSLTLELKGVFALFVFRSAFSGFDFHHKQTNIRYEYGN